LTPEEHFVAHQLLIKIHPESDALVYAARMMAVKGNGQERNNKEYGWIRRRYHKICQKRIGRKNPSYGRRWYHNPITKEVGKFLVDDVPDGWIIGRSQTELRVCVNCNNTFRIALSLKDKYCSKKCRRDARAKYRAEANSKKKIVLTEDQISSLYQRYLNGESIKDIHREYGIGQRKAYYIINEIKNKGSHVPRVGDEPLQGL